MSDSESDYTDAISDSESENGEVFKKLRYLEHFKPDYKIDKYTTMADKLRTKLNTCKGTSNVENPGRRSDRIDDRKKLEESYRELQQDFVKIHKRLDNFWDIMSGILDKMEVIDDRLSKVERFEERLIKLEENARQEPEVQTYSAAVRSQPVPVDTNRIEKLEFLSSEDERKKRLLHSTITHPNLNKNSDDLKNHVINFFETTMQMERRIVDLDLQAKKGYRDNTVTVIFSDKRYKIFMYQAKKALRQNNCPEYNGLFINDDLTSFNYKILMDLKNYRKSIGRNEDPFTSIYTRDGRIYVKLKESDATANGVLIKSPAYLQQLQSRSLGQNDATPSENSTTASPSNSATT